MTVFDSKDDVSKQLQLEEFVNNEENVNHEDKHNKMVYNSNAEHEIMKDNPSLLLKSPSTSPKTTTSIATFTLTPCKINSPTTMMQHQEQQQKKQEKRSSSSSHCQYPSRRRVITSQIYDEIVTWCETEIHNGSDFMFDKRLFHKTLQSIMSTKTKEEETFTSNVHKDKNNDKNDNYNDQVLYFEMESLLSLFRNLHLQYVKKIGSIKAKKRLFHGGQGGGGVIPQYVNDSNTTILQLSKQVNYPPYLLCRLIVERITTIGSNNYHSHGNNPSDTSIRNDKSPVPPPVSNHVVGCCNSSRKNPTSNNLIIGEPTVAIPSSKEAISDKNINNSNSSNNNVVTKESDDDSNGNNNVEETKTFKKTTIIMAMRDPMNVLNDLNIIREEYIQSEPHYCHHRPTQQQQKQQQDEEQKVQVTSCTAGESDVAVGIESNDSVINSCIPVTSCSPTPAVTDPATGSEVGTDSQARTTNASPTATTRTTTRLARLVHHAICNDPMYGPRHDRERHFVGIEYEVLLESKLKDMGIPFETETHLRQRGVSKTPDILLTCPIGVQIPSTKEWKVICWIDSKALFGDIDTHTTSVLPQVESYVHRFGPGMVLYWFGHAPLNKLGTAKGDVVIWGWDLPETFMWPTGEIGGIPS